MLGDVHRETNRDTAGNRGRFVGLSPGKIAAVYAVFGVLWILFSDQILHMMAGGSELEAQIQTLKGWTYVFVTALLVYVLVKEYASRLESHHQRVRDSESLFRVAFETSPDMVTIVNLDSRKVVAVNDGFTRITGYGRDEAIGRTTQALGLWVDDRQRERLFNQIEASGVVENMEIRLRRKDGREVLCQFSCRVLELDGHLHSVAISRDVTALKTAEASLNRAMEDLEDRVEERTRALRQEILGREAIERSLQEANEKLEERVEERSRELEAEIAERVRAQNESLSARDEAERANRAKTVFLANMSHELRTPLNSIIGFSDVLASQMFGPLGREQYVDYARDINESGRQLLELVNDILDISRIEVDAISLNEMHVDIGRLLKTCIRSTEKNIADAGLDFECDLADGLPALYADERRVRQILLNLISNARKFTPAGGDVRIAASLDPDGRIALRVSDTGIGIAPEDMATALSTFGQADDDLSRRFQGAGIGLPLSRKLAELHGATLTVESAVGKGTNVTVLFPQERTVFLPRTEGLESRRPKE